MAEIIKVTPQKLRSAAGDISSLASDYKSLYTKLYQEADGMNSSWDAADNVAYIKRIKEFEEDFKAMYDLMMDYVDYLETSAAAYEKTQDDVITQAGRLRV